MVERARRRLRARASRALAGCLGAVCMAGAGAGDATACEARVELTPREAFVGEQVLHEIVFAGVARDARIEWLAPPELPDARVVTLPPPPPGAASDRLERRERRALWPARPGTLVLPAARYRCTAAASADGVFSTPAVALQVRPVPAQGRPEGWRGLVGEVALTLRASATEVHVGETFELRAVATGRGHMKQAELLWPRRELEAQAPAPELFDRPAQLFEQPGRDVVGRRTALLDVVPQAAGRLRVPPVSVAWFDPEAESFRWTRSAELEIEVLPASPAREAGGAPATTPAPPRRGGAGRLLGGVAALGLAAVVALVAVVRRRRARGG